LPLFCIIYLLTYSFLIAIIGKILQLPLGLAHFSFCVRAECPLCLSLYKAKNAELCIKFEIKFPAYAYHRIAEIALGRRQNNLFVQRILNRCCRLRSSSLILNKRQLLLFTRYYLVCESGELLEIDLISGQGRVSHLIKELQEHKRDSQTLL
jgi:hypothetical protein